MIDDTYEQFAPYWDTGLAMKSESVQAQLSYLGEKEFPRVKDARPTDFFENSFVENLKRSGFLQSLGLPN